MEISYQSDFLHIEKALQPQDSDMDPKQGKNKVCNIDSKDIGEIQVDIKSSDEKTALKTQEVTDLVSDPKKENCILDLNDNEEIEVDTETSGINTTGNAHLQLGKFSNMNSIQEESNCKLDAKDFAARKRLEDCYILAWKLGKYFNTFCNEDVKKNSGFDSTDEEEEDDDIQVIHMSSELEARNKGLNLMKRKQKDEKKVHEYCGRPCNDKFNPLQVPRVAKRGSPQTQSSNEVSKRIKMELESDTSKRTDNTFEAMEEKLQYLATNELKSEREY